MPYPVCPSCGGRLLFDQVNYRAPFDCPLCGASAEVAPYYGKLGGYISIALTLALCFFLSFRGIWILLGFVALLLPVMAAQSILLRVLFPLPLRACLKSSNSLIGSSLGLDYGEKELKMAKVGTQQAGDPAVKPDDE
jgi:hypothetical protein